MITIFTGTDAWSTSFMGSSRWASGALALGWRNMATLMVFFAAGCQTSPTSGKKPRVSLRRFLLALLLAPLFAAIFALACGGTSTSNTIPPITGIVVRAETLTTGRGCGQGPGQVFKYAAAVYGLKDPTGDAGRGPYLDPDQFSLPVTAAIFDCFTDGTFVQLPPQPNANGSFTYRVEVFVFDSAALAAAQAATPSLNQIVGEIAPAFLDAGLVGAAMMGRDQLRATLPTWTTTCYATQQQDVQVLAVCDPLSFGKAGLVSVPDAGTPPAAIELGTQGFALPDGGIVACDDGDGGIAVPEAGPPDDAGDAGDAGDAEAGPPPPTVASTFRTVTVVPSTGGATLQAATVACPSVYHLEPPQQVGSFTLDVTLRAADGTAVGHTTCAAAAEPGRTSSAACQPVTPPPP
jgi:hypothetical protein